VIAIVQEGIEAARREEIIETVKLQVLDYKKYNLQDLILRKFIATDQKFKPVHQYDSGKLNHYQSHHA
jgi:hypothetical protein